MSTTASAGAGPVPSFYISTVGCAKNEVDSDAMRARLLAAGYVEAPGPEGADVCLVNTCGFLAEATRESIEVTLEAAGLGSDGTSPKVVMCGCVPSRYGSELPSELPEVDAFVAADDEEGIAAVVEGLVGSAGTGRRLKDAASARTAGGATAFLKIAEGCDRHCTFCAIPAIRGPFVSRLAEDIVAEARYLVEGGARELVLVAQDTSSWGRDLPHRPHLASLLRNLSEELEGTGTWIRVLYLQPEGLDDELIDVFAEGYVESGEGVLPYIDMPLQHASGRLLGRMGRKGDAESFSKLIARLRERIPGVVLRTTVICGFPGETDEEHEELLAFLRREAFDYVAVFAYSPEEGTPAATMEGQIEGELKRSRTQAALDVAEELGFASAEARVGGEGEIVIDAETPDDPDGALAGHAWFQAPDTDGIVHVSADGAGPGDKLTVRFVDAWCYDLEGEVPTCGGAL